MSHDALCLKSHCPGLIEDSRCSPEGEVLARFHTHQASSRLDPESLRLRYQGRYKQSSHIPDLPEIVNMDL